MTHQSGFRRVNQGDVKRLLREVGESYHDCAIAASDDHPAVTWDRCEDILCIKVRELLETWEAAK